jgi:hypothetical protein
LGSKSCLGETTGWCQVRHNLPFGVPKYPIDLALRSFAEQIWVCERYNLRKPSRATRCRGIAPHRACEYTGTSATNRFVWQNGQSNIGQRAPLLALPALSVRSLSSERLPNRSVRSRAYHPIPVDSCRPSPPPVDYVSLARRSRRTGYGRNQRHARGTPIPERSRTQILMIPSLHTPLQCGHARSEDFATEVIGDISDRAKLGTKGAGLAARHQDRIGAVSGCRLSCYRQNWRSRAE